MNKSTDDRYGTVAVALHWLSAGSLLLALVLGFSAAAAADDPNERFGLLRLHLLFGATTLLLTVTRIVWWTAFDSSPVAQNAVRWRRIGARGVHNLLYMVILTTASLGAVMVVDSGAFQTLVGAGAPTVLPDFWKYPWRPAHGLAARLVILLLLIHSIVAIICALHSRGRTLKRMWF